MYILGISAYYHDSAAVILRDGEIVAAAQEERFTRKKHDPFFPENAIAYCLEAANITVDDLGAVTYYEKPFLKFERLLETYYALAPRGVTSFRTSMPSWVKEKLLLKKLLIEELSRFSNSKTSFSTKLLFPEHHLSHASSAFFPSPYQEAAILTLDGVGEWATASICHGKGNQITMLQELRFPHSPGLFYSAVTVYLGFKVNSGEYKLMGLAPFGNPVSERVHSFKKRLKDNIIDLKADGSLWLNQEYFDYTAGLTMVVPEKWERLFGFGQRKPESELLAEHCDLGLAAQQIMEDVVLAMAAQARHLTGARHLCLAGGVALNCVANGKLLKQGLFDGIWIQPAAGDAGGALGAALAAHHIHFNNARQVDGVTDSMKGSYLGPQYDAHEIEKMARSHKAPFRHFSQFEELCETVAELLAEGSVIGWFQSRMEWGPRALGNRSIIADARNPEMQKKLNLKIKFREGFRPFAPSVLFEDVATYFELDSASPYMLLVADVRQELRKKQPEGYHELPIRDKLYFLRSDIPSVTHIDFSARIQTVHADTNPHYWKLIQAFKRKTGYGVIVNTSFNVRGEPIVMSPDDAYKCFMRTEMDCLAIGNYLFVRDDQPAWIKDDNWKKEYGLD